MSRYTTWIDPALMEYFRGDGYLPDGMRMVRELDTDEHGGAVKVELDDDQAPAELDGRDVTLMFSQDGTGRVIVHGRTMVG
jgi:hypothetical protein